MSQPEKPSRPPLTGRYITRLSIRNVAHFCNEMKKIAKKWEGSFQCAFLEKKGLARGARLSLCFLAYAPLTTKEQYEAALQEIRHLARLYLESENFVVAVEWNPERKVQIRFNPAYLYVEYSELEGV